MMKMTTTSDYFERFVWNNYARFRAEPGSLCLAMNAVVAAYHVAEWIAACNLEIKTGRPPSADDVDREARMIRATVANRPEFGLLEDVATAYKHVVTRPRAAAKRSRFFTELVAVRTQATPTVWSDRDAWDDDKQWQDEYGSAIVTDHSNNAHEVLMLLNKVVAYWGDYLYGSSPQWVQRRPHEHTGKGVLR